MQAAVLHDTVEDTNTTLEEIDQLFGQEVRSLVDEVSDDKSLPKEERKRLQVCMCIYSYTFVVPFNSRLS